MIETKSLFFSYGVKNSFEFPDISLKEKDHLLIIGPSGVGKTTFLHLLAGLLRPQSGTIRIGNEDIAKINDNKLDKFRGKNIGLVFQKPHFIKSLSVEENLRLIQKLAGKKSDHDRIYELLKRLGIEQTSMKKTYQLSQGQQQRLSIALALVNRPSLILADEPTSSLDDLNCEEVLGLLKEQAGEESANLIVITHDSRLKSHFENQLSL